MNHAETAADDTPKERALRLDYEDADFEVQQLKAKLRRARMIPLSEEAEEMFYWRGRCKRAEEILRQYGLMERLA